MPLTIKKELEGLNVQDACSKDAADDARRHALALLLLPASKKEVAAAEPENGIVLEELDTDDCIIACCRCGSTDRYVKCGMRKNKKDPQQQLYMCENDHKFTFNPGFERRRYCPNDIITKAVRLFLGAMSSRRLQAR